MVSERAKRFGCDKPLVGDLVLVETENKQMNKSNNNAGRRNPFQVKRQLINIQGCKPTAFFHCSERNPRC